jgi:KDO2-lipid IV(A) lauroyltransferase
MTPHTALVWAARAGGFLHWAIARHKRSDRTANLAAASLEIRCPPWRAFQTQALNVIELLAAVSSRDHSFLRRMFLHGEEHLRKALESGRGVILATFHSGNWELAGLMLAERGFSITTVAGEQLRPGWSEEIKSLKRRFGIRVLNPGAELRALYEDIRANRAVVLHLDGDLFTGGYNVTFLGRRVKAPRGPAHLARVLSCPVAFAYCRRTRDHRLHVWIEPAVEPPRSPREEIALTQSLMRRVEKGIVDDPGQWCIFRRLPNTVEPTKS